MQVQGLESVRDAMEHEDAARKRRIAIGQVTHMIAAAAIGTVFIVWYANVLYMQSSFQEFCDDVDCKQDDIILYDVAFKFGPYQDP